MSTHNIACVIITNSDDLCFLDATLRQTSSLFSQTIISTGNKLWNGEDDNMEKVNEFKKKHPTCQYVTYDITKDKISFVANQVSSSMYWEAHARWVALQRVDITNDYVLFLDADEVIDGEMFGEWLKTETYKTYDAMKLANYWYWRVPTLRAKDYLEDSAVMMRRAMINPFMLFSNQGRHGIFEACRGSKKVREVKNKDGKAMIHHYSWVRTKDAMLRKVRNWGHKDDCMNWEQLVENEYITPVTETHTDFLKGLSYLIVDNCFDINIEV